MGMYRPESCRANMNNTTMLFFWIPWRVAILRRKRWSTRGYWAPKVGMYINTNFERASTCWWLNHAWSKYESPLGGPFWRGGVGNLLPIQLNNHRHDPNLPKQQLNLQMQVILCSMFFLELPTPGSLFAYTLTVLATEGKIETGCLRELAGLGFDASSTWFCLCRHSFNHMFAWFRILLPSLNVGEEEGKGNEGSAAVQWLWRGEKTQVYTSLHREGCVTYQWYSVLLLVLLLGLTVSTCYLLSPPKLPKRGKTKPEIHRFTLV